MAYPRLVDDPFALSRGAEYAAPVLSGPPRLLVVVDVEETFDWHAPFDRNATDTRAMSEIGRGQELCDAAGVAPTYVVDFPVASDARAMDSLSSFAKRSGATIGAHLHCWVCPPHEEEVNAVNSYQGNLPAPLEREKLETLCTRIEENSGFRPTVHKAGRYGFGWGTAENLLQLGFRVDLSPTPGFDLTADGGPNHENVPNAPHWLDPEHRLLSIAGTGGFVGMASNFGPWLYRFSENSAGQKFRLGGIMSRLGVMERIRLSPEGFSLTEMKKLTYSLLRRGEKVFTLTYHSPSLALGCTPYVQDEQDRRNFLNTIRNFLEFFFNELGGLPATPLGLLAEIQGVEKAEKQGAGTG